VEASWGGKGFGVKNQNSPRAADNQKTPGKKLPTGRRLNLK
jgi:hypothetical protein